MHKLRNEFEFQIDAVTHDLEFRLRNRGAVKLGHKAYELLLVAPPEQAVLPACHVILTTRLLNGPVVDGLLGVADGHTRNEVGGKAGPGKVAKGVLHGGAFCFEIGGVPPDPDPGIT